MSSLKNSYNRIVRNNGKFLSINEYAEELGILYYMIDIRGIPASSSIYLSILTPDIPNGASGLLGRSMFGYEQGGIKYRVWGGATDIVYSASPDVTLNPGGDSIWRRVDSVTLTGASLIDEIWVPESDSIGNSDNGTFEQIQEIKRQPNNIEIIIELENTTTSSVQFNLKLIYLEDKEGLIIRPLQLV